MNTSQVRLGRGGHGEGSILGIQGASRQLPAHEPRVQARILGKESGQASVTTGIDQQKNSGDTDPSNLSDIQS